jgi:hypothetical protein
MLAMRATWEGMFDRTTTASSANPVCLYEQAAWVGSWIGMS